MKLLRSIFAILVLAFACPALAQNSPPTAITPTVSASAAATSLIVVTKPSYYWDGYCQSSSAGRCILYDSTTVPGSSLTPGLVLECSVVAAGGQGGWQYGIIPRRSTTGMVVLFSTGADCNTYTASSTAYIHASAMPQ